MSALRATVDFGQLIRSAPLYDLTWAAESHAPPADERGELPRRSAAPQWLARIPGRYRHGIPYFSIIRPFFGQDCAECWRLVDLMESRPPPSDDIGRKKETPMDSTPTAIEPRDALVARADEQFAHVHEQLAKMDSDVPRPPSAGPRPQSPPRRPARGAFVGLPLAACIVVAGLVLYSSYGSGAKLLVARWAPQLALTPSLPPENPQLLAQPALSTVQVAAAEAAPPQATLLAQTAPQDAAPTATPALPDPTQLLQKMARDLANLERNIEQLKANQQQMAVDNSKAIGELKASQEEIKRVLAKVSEQNPPRTSPPPTQPTPTLRKPERTLQSPYARARPRIPREWIDDEW